MANFVIITAAGSGKRMQNSMNKIFMLINNEPIISRTVRVFQENDLIDQIILVGKTEDKEQLENIVDKNNFSKVSNILEGGNERQDSVCNGILALQDKARSDDIVLVHNAVNPFVDLQTINNVIEATQEHGAAVAGFPTRDTIKEVNENGFVDQTLDRKKLWQVQTPQALRYSLALDAFNKAKEAEFYGTDDVMLVERLNLPVKMIQCSYENIKITLPNDLDFADKLLTTSRVGFGMDSHRFEEETGKALVIGGIEVPEHNGFRANSDGDIILHALFNAIAEGLGDHAISYYADPMCKEGVTDSKEYLAVILKIMQERGYQLSNVCIMLEGKTPKILPLESRLKDSIDSMLKVGKENIGIVATTGEGLSDFGKGLGMQCFCVVTLNKA